MENSLEPKLRSVRPLENFARMVWQRFFEDGCMSIASDLAFTTLLALVPIIVVALAVLSAFPVFRETSVQLQTFLLANLIPESAASVTTYAQELSDNAAGLTIIGLVFLFVTATLLLLSIDKAFNRIWRVRRPPRVARRIFIYGMLLTVAPVLIGLSLSLTSWVVSVSLGLVKEAPYAVLVLLRIVPIVLTGFAFAMLYITLPNRRVRARDALAGGFLSAAAFEATKHGFALYITRFPAYKLVYGAFAAIPIFLIWIYLSWVVVLFGAAAAAVLPEWRERTFQLKSGPDSLFRGALQILHVLWEGQGAAVRERRLHGIVKIPIDQIETILDAMNASGWIGRGRGGWILARNLSGVRVADVYELFVFRGDPRLPVRQSGEELDRHALELAGGVRENLALSVEALFAQTAPKEKDRKEGSV
ncbi:MAG TPA: YihY family inner membrane protein [Burkholderiales bacterium]|nr:YihY family inner membrane protein [Burkholderiales bacterium]